MELQQVAAYVVLGAMALQKDLLKIPYAESSFEKLAAPVQSSPLSQLPRLMLVLL